MLLQLQVLQSKATPKMAKTLEKKKLVGWELLPPQAESWPTTCWHTQKSRGSGRLKAKQALLLLIGPLEWDLDLSSLRVPLQLPNLFPSLPCFRQGKPVPQELHPSAALVSSFLRVHQWTVSGAGQRTPSPCYDAGSCVAWRQQLFTSFLWILPSKPSDLSLHACQKVS